MTPSTGADAILRRADAILRRAVAHGLTLRCYRLWRTQPEIGRVLEGKAELRRRPLQPVRRANRRRMHP